MQKFNYHTHTYRCGHAAKNMKDEDYIKDFIKEGFEKMAFTDHCPQKNKIDTRDRMRMEYEDRIEYLASIQKLKEKYASKIEIESGYEIEYLPGEEENLRELKEEVDKVILGQHFVYDDQKNLKIFGKMDFTEEELLRYAEYIEQAVENGLPDIIAHPDIYLYKVKEFGKTEEEVARRIAKIAEKYQIPLEINLAKIYHHFVDGAKIVYPSKEFWKIISEYNVKVLYGIDAHYKGQIPMWKKMVEKANEVIGEETLSKLNFQEK